MTFPDLIEKIEQQCRDLVWWSPDQIARGEHVLNDPKKGERAWAVPRATAEFLHELVSRHRPQTILELGTSIGYSTVWMAHAAAQYNGHIHTIEQSLHKIPIAHQNIIEGSFESTVTIHEGSIKSILEHLAEKISPIDMVFMDADRGHYHEYFPLIEPFLSRDAIIVADNAVSHHNRMQPFLELLAHNGWDSNILEIDNGILLSKRY